MIERKLLMLALGLATAVLIGCHKNAGLDTGPLEKSFSSAEPDLQILIGKVVTAIKTGDYNAAVVELSALSGSSKLTTPQQQTVTAVLQQAQKMAALTPPKTVDQLPMAMPKKR